MPAIAPRDGRESIYPQPGLLLVLYTCRRDRQRDTGYIRGSFALLQFRQFRLTGLLALQTFPPEAQYISQYLQSFGVIAV